jgi:hypothetical protein
MSGTSKYGAQHEPSSIATLFGRNTTNTVGKKRLTSTKLSFDAIDRGIVIRVPVGARYFLVYNKFWPALGMSILCSGGYFPGGDKSLKLTTHHLVRRIRSSRAIPPFHAYLHGRHTNKFASSLSGNHGVLQ